jgi:carnitine O-acetyltransferase
VEIKFVTDETIENGIRKAVKDFAKVMGQHELVVSVSISLSASPQMPVLTNLAFDQACHYDKYGKNVIKKYKCSPDAWAQMVKQLAYGKMHGGKPAVTYESAQTRKFALGRTEVIRSASKESKAFVEAMLGDASVSPTRNCGTRSWR